MVSLLHASREKPIPDIPGFKMPEWAGKPPQGLHLDVLKEKGNDEWKMVQKMMIDEKKVYYFGRNSKLCDFPIDHASCSRIHSALIFHKHLNRSFLIDLGSTHGTFIGTIRLEQFKPTQVLLDSIISFGASTRRYVLRERPQTIGHDPDGNVSDLTNLIGLPEDDNALENLTEFNTAHNKRTAVVSNMDEKNDGIKSTGRKRKMALVRFKEAEEVINPEDIDPTIGRFRNMVQTAFVPKKAKIGSSLLTGFNPPSVDSFTRPIKEDFSAKGRLYAGVPELQSVNSMIRVNSAPDVDSTPLTAIPLKQTVHIEMNEDEPKKKFFPKEAWPGKKPSATSLI